jgi:hypothetical protein
VLKLIWPWRHISFWQAVDEQGAVFCLADVCVAQVFDWHGFLVVI